MTRTERAPCPKLSVLDVVSPDESNAGIPELADVNHGAVEPVITVVNPEAAGTVYWLAAQDRELLSPIRVNWPGQA